MDEETALQNKIVRQLEYYFGDFNMSRDVFMVNAVKEDDGWLTIDVLLKFNRLKNLSSDKTVVAKAVEKSSLLQLSEDSSKIRRDPEQPVPAFSDQHRDEVNQRSVYAKGFPNDATLDDLQEFFDKFGKAEHIQRRRDAKKQPKDSVFVIFDTTESAQNFINAEDLKFNENEIPKMFRKDYFNRKKQTRHQQRSEKQKLKAEAEKKEVKEKFKERMVLGSVLFISSVPDATSREDLKAAFTPFGKLAWIDFSRGQKQGHIRFEEEGGASAALEKAGGAVEVKETKLDSRVIEGEEEENYWRKIVKEQRNQRKGRQRRGKKRRKSLSDSGDDEEAQATKSDGDDNDNADAEATAPAKKAKQSDDEAAQATKRDGDAEAAAPVKKAKLSYGVQAVANGGKNDAE